MLGITGCGDGIYKCVFEKKNKSGAWEKHCETFTEDEVIDLETYCDKYDGYKTHSVTPSETTYSSSVEYRNPRREAGACEPEDGEES